MRKERPRDKEFRRRWKHRNDPQPTIQEKTLWLLKLRQFKGVAPKNILRILVCKALEVESHSIDREWRKLKSAGKIDYDDTHIYLPVKMIQEPAF